MAATLQFMNNSTHHGILVILKIPNISTLPVGKIADDFPLPKPFQHISGYFYNTGLDITFKTTKSKPGDFLYNLNIRGKTGGSYLNLADEVLTRGSRYNHYDPLYGARPFQRLAKWKQEDGSLIFELEIAPRTPKDQVVKPRATRDELFASIYGNDKFSDFSLVCEGKTIKVAKAIIAPQSDFFRALIESDMEESDSGEVEIKNMTFDTLNLLMKFLYSGKIEGHINRDVLVAADYLSIVNFKEHYEEFATQNLNLETISEVLYNAENFKMPNLEKVCFKFLDSNKAWSTVYKNMMTNKDSNDAKRQRVEMNE